MIVEPIGVVKSPVTQTIDENWGNVLSEIHLAPNLHLGLTGIDQFHYIIVVFHMHKASFDLKKDLIRRPQGRPDMPEVGIFAQRAKHRPNSIGMTAVQLMKVDGNVLIVKGLDAIDGTPILDIKPYYPAFDRIEEPRSPEWVERLMEKYF
jgi:tRNA-Thr(GGU) m(6)t(6)A37 methyltransferase TsaA